MSHFEELGDRLARFFSGRSHQGVVSAYLFGSHSSGRAHRESDIDVAVLLEWNSYPTRRARFEEGLRLSTELMAALGTSRVDTLILNDVPAPLGARVVTTGRRVYCSNQEIDRAFFRDVQLRAADLAPFLLRTRRVKLAAITQ